MSGPSIRTMSDGDNAVWEVRRSHRALDGRKVRIILFSDQCQFDGTFGEKVDDGQAFGEPARVSGQVPAVGPDRSDGRLAKIGASQEHRRDGVPAWRRSIGAFTPADNEHLMLLGRCKKPSLLGILKGADQAF